MLRIGKLTDYALLILSQLAKTPLMVTSATSLAEILHLSAPTVSKILKILSEANLVRSVRGADGGYQLAKGAEAISVADIIAAMEGDIAMTECCEGSLCTLDSICTLRDNWRKINNLMYGVLATFTLSDMLTPIAVAFCDGSTTKRNGL